MFQAWKLKLPYLLIGLFIWGAGGFLTYLKIPPVLTLIIFIVGLIFVILGTLGYFLVKKQKFPEEKVLPEKKSNVRGDKKKKSRK